MPEQMRKDLYTRVAIQLLLFVPVAGVLLFLPAGTFDYWEAWLFAMIFFACTVALAVYLIVSVALLLFVSMPLALGSWWGVVILAPSVLMLAWRLLDEEKFLHKNLPGYTEYAHRVRYRLVPHVW